MRWLFLLCAFLPSFGFTEEAKPMAGFEEFRYVPELLESLGKLETVDEMIESLQTKHGVRVIVVPRTEESLSKASPTAQKYFSLLKHTGDTEVPFAGLYLGRYADIGSSAQVAQPTRGILGWKDRPYGDEDVILLRSDAVARYVLLHEFNHHLINKNDPNREKVNGDDKAYQEARSSRVKSLMAYDDPKALAELSPREVLALMDQVGQEASQKLKEEIANNLTLLRHSEALGIDIVAYQEIMHRLRDDYNIWILPRAKELSDMKQLALEHGFDEIASGLSKTLSEMDELREEVETLVDKAASNQPHSRWLNKLNARGIVLQPFNPDARFPLEILGLANYPAADSDTISDAYRYWANRYHPDHGGDTESFKRVQSAFEAATKPQPKTSFDDIWNVSPNGDVHLRQYQDWLRGEQALRSAKRFVTKFATACAIGAAYCAFDEKLPWSQSTVGIDFGWQWPLMAFSASTIKPASNPQDEIVLEEAPMTKGAKTGAMIGTGMAVCWEILKALGP